MTRRMLTDPISRPQLDALLERARHYKMTRADYDAQRVSWVAGELGIEHPELSAEECTRRAQAAVDAVLLS